jgi:hypothetical protein
VSSHLTSMERYHATTATNSGRAGSEIRQRALKQSDTDRHAKMEVVVVVGP